MAHVEVVVMDWLPEGAVPLSTIEIVEFLNAETGEYLIVERYWTADGVRMPLFKKLGLLEQAKAAACIPMIQSAPDMTDDNREN
ncbi:hypothetical protein ABH922_003006 [Rhodococcus sp. 27YEA15]|uniref:hypothetical protein n=1 Tax=Rhodococcus sp. 27YEA15 TaxID=3156259 RepID=UPI003C7D9C91